MNLNRWNIGTRLAAAFAVLLALLALVLSIGVLQLQDVAQSTRQMMDKPLAKERLVSDWYRTIHTSVRRSLAVAKSSDTSLAEFFATENQQSTKDTNALVKQLEPLLETDAEKQLFARIGVVRQAYIKSRDAVTSAKAAGKAAEANTIFEQEFRPAGDNYLQGLKALLDEERKAINQRGDEVESSFRAGRLEMLAAGLLALAVALALAWRITRGITRPIAEAVRLAHGVAAGDLTLRIEAKSHDETGQLLRALDAMSERLRAVVGEVRSGVESVVTASGQIASGNQDLSARTEQTAANLEETAASIEELTSTVEQSAATAAQVNQLAGSAAQAAHMGGEVVQQVVASMHRITASSKKISDIIGVIDGIAFQTNILALNAAVEAARAGEQGRGFAVVAGEVRALAQRSAEAAKEIKALIDDSVQNVEAGSAQVAQAGQRMQDIVGGVKHVPELIGDIRTAAREQSNGFKQVNQAIVHLDQMTQQNAALVEESTAAARALRDQAQRLADVVAAFNVGTSQQQRALGLRQPTPLA